jgi:hypothetical protein
MLWIAQESELCVPRLGAKGTMLKDAIDLWRKAKM